MVAYEHLARSPRDGDGRLTTSNYGDRLLTYLRTILGHCRGHAPWFLGQ
jgi:hypothetical protein